MLASNIGEGSEKLIWLGEELGSIGVGRTEGASVLMLLECTILSHIRGGSGGSHIRLPK